MRLARNVSLDPKAVKQIDTLSANIRQSGQNQTFRHHQTYRLGFEEKQLVLSPLPYGGDNRCF